MSKKKCLMCHKNIGAFIFNCHQCGNEYCTHCRLPEDHKCSRLKAMQEKKHDDLVLDLNNKATHDNHNFITKI